MGPQGQASHHGEGHATRAPVRDAGQASTEQAGRYLQDSGATSLSLGQSAPKASENTMFPSASKIKLMVYAPYTRRYYIKAIFLQICIVPYVDSFHGSLLSPLTVFEN